ncbi:hypothetical protein ETAA8_11130 [Anatilimnocola aggregata]|uniref:Uncharacterized protein n=1 Tax=Anatilimnocola aggregata TaxID=2528021 RepID=A0A517Y732_9BACT|nr:hypothetical protein ETAA8_11130 [Anatilimnocola aggregata]
MSELAPKMEGSLDYDALALRTCQSETVQSPGKYGNTITATSCQLSGSSLWI